LDASYIDLLEFEDLYERSAEVERLIGGFINYLEKH